MIQLLENYLFQNKALKTVQVCLVLLFSLLQVRGQQIGNYVNNGSFEACFKPDAIYSMPYFWRALDSSKSFGVLMASPVSSAGFQYPKHGSNYLAGLFYSFFPNLNRTYPLNRLKTTLSQGKSYCVKMHVNLTDQSTHGIDAIGFYFGDHSLDTIGSCTQPITYLTPQVTNPAQTIIKDTMNWVVISGTFTATGNEKYLVIGNFRSNANTDTALANPTNLPAKWAEYLIDAVSCIEVDLPAYAGRDTVITPGTPVFLGREPDFAIDPGCTWYQLPDLINPIYDKAGLWVNPVVTTTYIVKQVLDCSSEKLDTVVVYVTPVGLEKLNVLRNELRVYPQPAENFVQFQINHQSLVSDYNKLTLYNIYGQVIREEEVHFVDGTFRFNTTDIPSGIYQSVLSNNSEESVSRKLVIAR